VVAGRLPARGGLLRHPCKKCAAVGAETRVLVVSGSCVLPHGTRRATAFRHATGRKALGLDAPARDNFRARLRPFAVRTVRWSGLNQTWDGSEIEFGPNTKTGDGSEIRPYQNN